MTPKVSIAIISYNHENYIAQAIESALMQQVGFCFEIVIGEDCSTDRTREILLHYQAQYPNQIRLLLNETNIGALPNLIQTLQSCQGEYIALLEGDDYWLSPYKLQKQVDLLDHNPDCALCFHDAHIVYESSDREPSRFCDPDQKEVSTIENLFVKNFIPTASVIYRRKNIPNFPKWYTKQKMGDWTLYILNALHGNLRYMNEVMSVYRKHSTSAWASQAGIWQIREMIRMLEAVNIGLDYQYETEIERSLNFYYQALISSAQYESNQRFNALQRTLSNTRGR